ncbi:MAG: radical SAM protein [Candidatus Lokiarchaeota archaeon]|nr:radical SAM protein [Candidatus Lokiarchaeota archaeon]
MVKKSFILLVEPEFPFPNRSRNKANQIHKNFVPIPLLKYSTVYKEKGYDTVLIRGNQQNIPRGGYPKKIIITSLFTYWSEYFWNSVKFYRNKFPNAEIEGGGIYVSLLHKSKDFKEKAKKYQLKSKVGVQKEAEEVLPDYSIIDCDYHVSHIVRGCIRRCSFCGTWKIEPKLTYKDPDKLIEELKAVKKNKVIFYDNNILAHPQIELILEKLIKLKINNKPVTYESQSGYDGRILLQKSKVAKLLKQAHFLFPRIAWDNGIEDYKDIKKQIELLVEGGYSVKEIQVFMIYNYDIPCEEMLKKIKYCKEWGVQISDCRYRPLDQLHDYYNPGKHKSGQTDKDYYIHKKGNWTDKKIRAFRKQVRYHNIGIRYGEDNEYDAQLATVYSPMKHAYKKLKVDKKIPRVEDYNKKPTIRERVDKMKRLVSYCLKHKYQMPDFGGMDYSRIDRELDSYLDDRSLLCSMKDQNNR